MTKAGNPSAKKNSAAPTAAASSAPKAPRANRTSAMGPGMAISAAAAGRVSASANSVARQKAARAPGPSSARTRRDSSGNSTTPMATPTTPRGS